MLADKISLVVIDSKCVKYTACTLFTFWDRSTYYVDFCLLRDIAQHLYRLTELTSRFTRCRDIFCVFLKVFDSIWAIKAFLVRFRCESAALYDAQARRPNQTSWTLLISIFSLCRDSSSYQVLFHPVGLVIT